MEKAKVYFTKEITPESVVRLYDTLGVKLNGKVAVKLHSGEEGNQNYLRPEFVENIVKHVNGTVVECNTAYDGARNTTEKHEKLMESHGWSKYFDVDIMDSESPDKSLEIPDGFMIKKDYVGKHIDNYDSMLVLSHFKGHPMGGYGGALKQLSIGVASSYGKAYIHGAGKPEDLWTANHDSFLESMADAAYAVHNYFKGNVVYINVMKNMSVDCDCCAVAEDPCLKDIGVLISTDPIAIDRACLDLVINSNDEGKKHFLERVNSRNGMHTIEVAEKHGFGTTNYELIDVDE
ncbi:MAG TPA: ferredoxin [Firmicutes bacterium]|nr:ferredoxin [Bacillota bacterium]